MDDVWKDMLLVRFLPKGLMDWLLGMTPMDFLSWLDTWDSFYGSWPAHSNWLHDWHDMGDQPICNQFESEVLSRMAMLTNGMVSVWCSIWLFILRSSAQSFGWAIAASLLLWSNFVLTFIMKLLFCWIPASGSWWVCFFFCLVHFGITSITLRILHASLSAHEKDCVHVCSAHDGSCSNVWMCKP